MLRLYVMRHAKSSWAVPGARDFDRELNERGNKDLIKISSVIAQRQYYPAHILCSPAERTRQTLGGIVNAIKPEATVEYPERLYSGGLQDYFDLVRSVDKPVSVMTIGHNPMSGSFANALVGDGDPDMISEISYRYPTATITVFDVPIDQWSQLQPNSATLVDCIIPSTLSKHQ